MLPIGRPTTFSSMSNTAAIVIPCSTKIGDPAIASAERPAGADEGDVVLALGAEDLVDLAEQACRSR